VPYELDGAFSGNDASSGNKPAFICHVSHSHLYLTTDLRSLRPRLRVEVSAAMLAIFSYRGCGNRALSIELIDAAEKG
jgi:hypothetical protein